MTENVPAERTVEERVAALETALFSPSVSLPMTDERIAEFKAKWAEAAEHHGVKWLPPGPAPLTPELARELLRECVTVVKPGETLVIRLHDGWTPDQVHEYQQYLNRYAADGRFRVLAVVGEELGIAEAAKPPCDCDPAQGEACSGCPD